MKHLKNKSGSRRRLLQTVFQKWHSKNYSEVRMGRSHTQTLAMNALGAAALLGTATLSLADDNSALMPEVVVTGQKEKDKKKYKPEELSSSKYTEPLRDTPQTVTVIPQELMLEQASTSLREVLKNVPGISIQAGEGGTPAGDQMTIRGFSARTDMFIDGVRDFGGYSRDPFNFSQVEVSKGPGSAYTGRGSTGGSINMVTKEAELERAYSGTAAIGTSQYQRYTLDVNEPLKALEGAAVRVNAMYHTNEVANRDITENNRWGVAPSVAFGLGTENRLTIDYFHLDQNNVPDYGIPWVPPNTGPLSGYSDQPAPTDWSNWYGLKDRDYEKVKTDIVTAKGEHDFSDEISLSNQTRYGQTKRDSIITSPRFADIDTGTAGDQFGDLIRRTDWKSRDQITSIIDNQTDLTLKFNTASIEHKLVPGVEITRENDRNYTRVKTGTDSQNTTLGNPNPDDPYNENIQRNGARLESTVDSIGVYAFDTLKFNEHWELSGGLRYDYFNVDFISINPNATLASNLGHIDRTLSWRTGVVYKPVEEGSIYAAYGTSFNPSAEGLATSALTSTPTATTNINLDPEKTETYEIGTKWDLFKKKVALTMALFRTNKTNARTEDPANAGDTVVLDGVQQVHGLELGINGSINEKWNVFAGYTYLLGHIIKSSNPAEVGNELSNTPTNTLNLWTTYKLPFNFEFGTGAQYVGERYNSTLNVRQMPAYWVGNAMLAYKLNKDVTMRLNMNNIADAEYIDSSSGGHFIPAPGQTTTLTTEFKF